MNPSQSRRWNLANKLGPVQFHGLSNSLQSSLQLSLTVLRYRSAHSFSLSLSLSTMSAESSVRNVFQNQNRFLLQMLHSLRLNWFQWAAESFKK